jgi:hypothetical protein
MNRPIKDFVAFVFASVLCGYAVWAGLQSVAIASMLAVLCVLYKPTASRAAEIGLGLLGRTSRAKYGDFEMEVERMVLGPLVQSPSVPMWAKALLSDMGAKHLGLLLALSKSDRIRINSAVVGSLRELRNIGLVEHDQGSLAGSEWVWLSSAGRDLVNALSGEDRLRSDGKPVPGLGNSGDTASNTQM